MSFDLHYKIAIDYPYISPDTHNDFISFILENPNVYIESKNRLDLNELFKELTNKDIPLEERIHRKYLFQELFPIILKSEKNLLKEALVNPPTRWEDAIVIMRVCYKCRRYFKKKKMSWWKMIFSNPLHISISVLGITISDGNGIPLRILGNGEIEPDYDDVLGKRRNLRLLKEFLENVSI